MARPAPEVLAWASSVLGSEVTVIRSLRLGGTPWLLRVGIDLGTLRCDAAWCHGLAAADDILRGWEAEAGRAARDVAYWDVVASLSSPPDMGWFPESMAAQGRPDLTREVMLERRDAFLAAALSQLGAVSY